jgi:hypothetical protein
MKKLIILLSILSIGCTKEDEINEQQFDCECERVVFSAVGTNPNQYEDVRLCYLPNLEFFEGDFNGYKIVKSATKSQLEVISKAQECN